MKKIISMLLIMMLVVVSFAACKSDNDSSNKYELALVTDIGTIDDKSFNQGSWEGLEKYAKDNNLTYKYYQPSEKTTDAYVAAISLAVKGGAKVIVTPGYLFEPAIFKVQDMYPDVSFVLLDGFPQDGTYTTFRIEDNVFSIFYAEEQVGFWPDMQLSKKVLESLGSWEASLCLLLYASDMVLYREPNMLQMK